jgi:hypothetical protein
MTYLAGPFKATCAICGWHLIVFRQTSDYISSPKDLPLRIICPKCEIETEKSSPSFLETMNPMERLHWIEYCREHGLG